MYKVVAVQFGFTSVVATIAGLLLGITGFTSAILGGVAYVLPNFLFAVRLSIAAETGNANSMMFVIGELGKLVATIVILAAAQSIFSVHWLAMLCGLFAALKANLFSLLFKT